MDQNKYPFINLFFIISEILLSLIISFALISKSLKIEILPVIITQIAGWIILISSFIQIIKYAFN